MGDKLSGLVRPSLHVIKLSGFRELLHAFGYIYSLEILILQGDSWEEAQVDAILGDVKAMACTNLPKGLGHLNASNVGENALDDIGIWMDCWMDHLAGFDRVQVLCKDGNQDAIHDLLARIGLRLNELQISFGDSAGERYDCSEKLDSLRTATRGSDDECRRLSQAQFFPLRLELATIY